jgi:alkylation response protein AidB-like acyl-CoA dehydrogenase
LHRFAERSGGYDRENRFFHEDFEDLRDAGYLTIPVPKELDGAGLTLAEVCREQRRLGYCAPATALGINMHLYWVGVAADLWRQCDCSLEWMLSEAMAGEVFNAGHSERGNDLPVLLSTSKAERVDGGFRITGHKMFGSLMPVWTRMGLHATWADAEGGPKVVHALLPRNYDGWPMVETWDTMGMRATRSDDTLLEGAFVPDKYIARMLPAGADNFIVAMFAWSLLGFGNIYCGIAQRAIDLALPGIKSKGSLGLSRSMAYHPEIQHTVAEMMLAFEPIAPHLEKVAEDWSQGVDHGAAWPAKDHRREIPRGRGVLADRRHGDGGVRRRRHVPRQRAGAVVPRREMRPLSPGQHLPGARDRREDDTWHRPWRAAALGVIAAASDRTTRRRYLILCGLDVRLVACRDRADAGNC